MILKIFDHICKFNKKENKTYENKYYQNSSNCIIN